MACQPRIDQLLLLLITCVSQLNRVPIHLHPDTAASPSVKPVPYRVDNARERARRRPEADNELTQGHDINRSGSGRRWARMATPDIVDIQLKQFPAQLSSELVQFCCLSLVKSDLDLKVDRFIIHGSHALTASNRRQRLRR